jgi:hypothetical protein
MLDRLFSREKPLPLPVLRPQDIRLDHFTMAGGVHLGGETWWNPEQLPNAHIVCIGASGSGKTQTLKAISYELSRTYTDARVTVINKSLMKPAINFTRRHHTASIRCW